VTNMLSDAAPQLPILEVPDNALMVDYTFASEMIDMFRANWPGGALDKPVAYATGYHPTSFSESYFSRMDDALTEIDKYLAVNDAGPVIYARKSDLPRAFPQQ
ncbi:MAG: hypothetical protein AB7R00_26190, partial [Kofleriaceae bacterium]